jgi:hypothetical protein
MPLISASSTPFFSTLPQLLPGGDAVSSKGESALLPLQNSLRANLAYDERHAEVCRIIFMTVPNERSMHDDTSRDTNLPPDPMV